jgi:aminoglycoside/choline kinase family phosphotransferase
MNSHQEKLSTWVKDTANAPSATLQPLNNDASFRHYYRVETPDGVRIVMDSPPDRENNPAFVSIARGLETADLNVPHIFAHAEKEGFLLLSDLGDDLYLPALKSGNVAQASQLYGKAFEALVQMQTHMPTTDLPVYDAPMLERELDLFPDWFLKKHLGWTIDTEISETLKSTFSVLIQAAQDQPQTFVHRDYHSRNLLIDGDKTPAIIDFQDAVLGAVTYDLVSLLRDAYIVWSPEQVQNWAIQYLHLAQAAGVIEQQISETDFIRWFDWMSLQRHLKVAGIFARLYHRDGKTAYLNDIPVVLNYLQEVANQYPEMADLARLLKKVGSV